MIRYSILADADEGLTTSRLFDGIVDVGIGAPKGTSDSDVSSFLRFLYERQRHEFIPKILILMILFFIPFLFLLQIFGLSYENGFLGSEF